MPTSNPTRQGVSLELARQSGEVFAQAYCTGAGTEVSPFVSADNTAGIGTALGEGVTVNLAPGRFNVTTPVLVRYRCTIRGSGEYPQAPGAFSEHLAGTRIKGFLGAFKLGDGSLSAPDGRINRPTIERLSLWGSGVTYLGGALDLSGYGIWVDEHADQVQIRRLSICNTFIGLYCKDGSLDASTIADCSFAGNAVAIYVETGSAFWSVNSIERCIFSDNYASAVVLFGNGDLTRENSVTNCVFVYNAGREDEGDPCHLLVGMNFTRVTNNSFWSAGRHYDTDGDPQPADAIIVTGDDCLFEGNTIRRQDTAGATANGTAYGAGIHVRSGAARTLIRGNVYEDLLVDVYVASGATDTTIDEPQGVNVNDNGTRTRINGRSNNAGDPDSAGDWNGVDKPRGLIIRDTVSGREWLYRESNARTLLNPGVDTTREVLGSPAAITEADGTYQTILSATAPAAGTYLVLATVQAYVNSSSGANPELFAKLRNTTTAADLNVPGTLVTYGAAASTQYSASTCIHAVATLAASDVVAIQCKTENGSSYNNRGVQSQGTHLQLVRIV